jgi:hypothetical protein
MSDNSGAGSHLSDEHQTLFGNPVFDPVYSKVGY